MGENFTHIAYLVVCWNNVKIIDECLRSIEEQTGVKKSIYVIDNDSSDGSYEYIKKNYSDITLIKSEVNSGFAIGNNKLIKECMKDRTVTHIALINSDAVIDKRWSVEIIDGLKGKQRVACAQGTTLDYYDHETIDSQHIYISDNFQSIQYGYTHAYDEDYAYIRKVFGVNAAAAVYTRGFIETQPGNVLFDERFYMYLEDVDVAFRSIMAGWNNYYIPKAKAYHMGSVSAKKRSNGYNYYMTYRNQMALIVKNAPLHTIVRFFLNSLRNDVRFYRHYKREDKIILASIIKGRIIGLVRAPTYITSRIQLKRGHAISSDQLERAMQNEGIFR